MNYFKNKSSQEVNTVYKTNDLEIFKQIEGNRPPNPQHIKRLAQSIRENGILCNPILVNEKYEVIDGQHRLMAAKKVGTEVFFIVLNGYDLNQVQTLNLNQKNWTQKDFMNGYADMGLKAYQELRDFYEENKDFNLSDCVAMCSNVTSSSSSRVSQKYSPSSKNKTGVSNIQHVFEEGTWETRDLHKAQTNADRIRQIGTFYEKYNRTVFVGTMLGMFEKKQFDFNEFMHKLRLQPTALVDCSNREQTKMLIEDIYNYKSRNKVNLRY